MSGTFIRLPRNLQITVQYVCLTKVTTSSYKIIPLLAIFGCLKILLKKTPLFPGRLTENSLLQIEPSQPV